MVVCEKVQQETGSVEDVHHSFFYGFILQKYLEALAIYFEAARIELYYPGFSETTATQ
jgi:hypothetical protein